MTKQLMSLLLSKLLGKKSRFFHETQRLHRILMTLVLILRVELPWVLSWALTNVSNLEHRGPSVVPVVPAAS